MFIVYINYHWTPCERSSSLTQRHARYCLTITSQGLSHAQSEVRVWVMHILEEDFNSDNRMKNINKSIFPVTFHFLPMDFLSICFFWWGSCCLSFKFSVLCLSLFCVLCRLCLWIIHFWLPWLDYYQIVLRFISVIRKLFPFLPLNNT